jgi:hypothetical protein
MINKLQQCSLMTLLVYTITLLSAANAADLKMSVAEAREIAARPSPEMGAALTAARVLEANSALPEALSLLDHIVSQSPDRPSAAEALFLRACVMSAWKR